MTPGTTLQIFPLTELRTRATNASEAVKSIKVYSGIGAQGPGRGALVLDIRRDQQGNWPESNFDYLERFDGEYTAILQPTKEVMFIESVQPGQTMRIPFNYGMLNGHPQQQQRSPYQDFDAHQLIDRILELERKLAESEVEKQNLVEELEELGTVQGKLQHVANGVFERYLFPLFAEAHPVTQPLNSPTSMSHNTQADDWTKYQIHTTDPDQAIQDAMEVLLAAFGNDGLIRIAKRLQQQPTLVNTLTTML